MHLTCWSWCFYHNVNYLIINYSVQLKYFPSADCRFVCAFYFCFILAGTAPSVSLVIIVSVVRQTLGGTVYRCICVGRSLSPLSVTMSSRGWCRRIGQYPACWCPGGQADRASAGMILINHTHASSIHQIPLTSHTSVDVSVHCMLPIFCIPVVVKARMTPIQLSLGASSVPGHSILPK